MAVGSLNAQVDSCEILDAVNKDHMGVESFFFAQRHVQQAWLPTKTTEASHSALTIDSVLENVMMHLDIYTRLDEAALVCQQWRKAAALATAEEGVHLGQWWNCEQDPDTHEPRVMQFLNKYAHRLTTIDVHDAGGVFTSQRPFISNLARLATLKACCTSGSLVVLTSMAQSLKVRHKELLHFMLPVIAERHSGLQAATSTSMASTAQPACETGQAGAGTCNMLSCKMFAFGLCLPFAPLHLSRLRPSGIWSFVRCSGGSGRRMATH